MNSNLQCETVNVWPQAAQILGVGRNTIYRAIRQGKVRVLRLGNRIVVPKAELQRLLRGEATVIEAEHVDKAKQHRSDSHE